MNEATDITPRSAVRPPGGGFLEGINVLDVTYYLPGPYASHRLAEMGADVTKIEPPGGEPARQLAGGLIHRKKNAGKTIVELDLKSEEGRERMKAYIREADVLIESFRPGTLERLGFGEDQLFSLNPGLIYCSMTGYGLEGTYAKAGSHDLNYLALSGVLSQLTDESGRPVQPKNTLADFAGGHFVTEAVCAALVRKMNTGEGARLDVSITDGLSEWQSVHLAFRDAGLSDCGVPDLDGSRARYAVYPTSDGRYVALGALEDKFWHAFCEFAGHPEWKEHDDVHEAVARYFRAKPLSHWLDVSLHTDFCLTPVLRPGELADHPHWKKADPGRSDTI